jgi:tetratricopeptide (TPR) repeat protein
MVVSINRARRIAGFLVAALLTCSPLSNAQEPSPSLKQADADYRAGVAALGHNDLNNALADFEKVVHLAPAVEQGHSALGAVLIRLGRTNEGILELEKALSIQSTDSIAQTNLAMAYEQSGRAAKALPWFAKLETSARAENRSLPATVLAAYARALAANRQFPAAVTRMKEAIAADPKNAEWHDELGSLYAQQQDWANARKAFSAAIEIDSGMAMAHMHLGVVLKAEQQPGALEELAKAYQLAPQNPVVAVEYGEALAAAGQDEQAIPVLQHALELSPNATGGAYQLGLALQRSNRVQDAIPLFQKAAAAEPSNSEILTNLGMALCQAQQAKDAVPILQHAVALTPDNATSHQNLAAAYIQLSQFDDAIRQLRAALRLSPNAPQLHYDLGLALKNLDDAAAAIPELEMAEKLDPSQPESPYLLGVLYLQAGRYEDAARELNLSLKLRPENGDGWATLGSVDNNLNKLPEAEAALREAIKQLPQQPDPHLTLAALLAKENQPTEATAERKKAADLMRANMNRQRAEVATNSAKSLLKSGKVEDAISGFREALSFDPNYAEAHVGLADALEEQGKTEDAAAERQRAQALQNAPQK